ncbi:MAG: serine hydroxymethyltransferase [Thermomicrobiales bacterium]
MSVEVIRSVDPELADIVQREAERQHSTIELIASENFTSAAVMAATGSVLTNKYAEGLPGRRYYGGCEIVDEAETLAIERARSLFGADHVNVQPYSGAIANLAAYTATLKPGDRILGMELPHGGHLTHGSPVTISGTLYEAHHYGVDPDTQVLDYDQVRDRAKEVEPKVIIAGASAYSRTIDFAAMRRIADEVGAILLADIAHIAGIVAAGMHPSPIGQAHITTTTTHKTLRGPRGGMIMADEDRASDIDKALFPGLQGGPLMHVIAAKAVGFKEALQPSFKEYISAVLANARALAASLQERNVDVISGGTDNHLMLVDLRRYDVSGRKMQRVLESAGLTTNRNQIPDDPRSAFQTTGIRLGTPAITTRGFTEDDMAEIGRWISDLVHDPDNEDLIAKIRRQAHELSTSYPLPGALISGD